MTTSNRRDGETESLLLEVGSEEIPARFLAQAQKHFGEWLQAALEEARLLVATSQHTEIRDSKLEARAEPEAAATDSGVHPTSFVVHPSRPALISEAGIQTCSTPRRLVAYVPGLLELQPDKVEEIMGPPVKTAFDKSGKPTRAAESFAVKNQVKVEDLYRVTTPKGEYLTAKKTTHGRPALEVLAELLPAVIIGLSFPKSMHWEAGRTRWVRPIRWILALLGEGARARVVPFEVAGVKSGRVTYGHRVLGPGAVEVTGFRDYAKKLRQMGVEYDPAERRRRVREQLKVLLEGSGLNALPDQDLEDWVVNSAEWPQALVGSFEERFLKLPREILITVMRDHQKYFAAEDANGNLQPNFVAVLNLSGDPQGIICQGHERVLTARFADAEFFWNADQKVPLRDRLPMLERVTYQAKLGSYGDKVRRMEAIARAVSDDLAAAQAERGQVLRAVQLCKCDLTTQMVQEFTELQGIVGGLYARAQGESPEVAEAIYDHYRPAGIGDSCPRSRVGGVVSLADKLDAVVAGFAAGLEPTGSSDPFGLRRAGNGIIKLAVELLAGLDLTILTNRFRHAREAGDGIQAVLGSGEMGQKIDRFLRERMEFYFREVGGLRYDTIRAVLKPTRILQDLVPSAALSRARGLERVRDTEDFLALASAAKRTRNIRKSASVADIVGGQADPALFTEQPERELWAAYQSLSQQIEHLSEEDDFEAAFRKMATIRPPVDRFFDKVLVMVEDATVRRNRLMLLVRLNEDVFTSLADLAEIAVEPRSKVAAGE